MTEHQRARTARVSVKWREVTDFETEVAVDSLREVLLSRLKPDAPHYDATVEKIETASAEELAEIAGDYIGAVTDLIIEGETLSTEDRGSEIELIEITSKPAPTSNLEPAHGEVTACRSTR